MGVIDHHRKDVLNAVLGKSFNEVPELVEPALHGGVDHSLDIPEEGVDRTYRSGNAFIREQDLTLDKDGGEGLYGGSCPRISSVHSLFKLADPLSFLLCRCLLQFHDFVLDSRYGLVYFRECVCLGCNYLEKDSGCQFSQVNFPAIKEGRGVGDTLVYCT